MAHIENITNGIADAAAMAATQEALKPMTMDEQEAILMAQIKEEEDKAKRMADLAAKLAEVKAENAKALADKAKDAKGKDKGKDKPAAKPAASGVKLSQAERLAKNIEIAIAAGQVVLPTDLRLGVINPKHLTDGDRFVLDIIKAERTPLEKLADKDTVPGTYARGIFSYFYGCNTKENPIFTQDKVNEILNEALTRNVISKLYIPTVNGIMVLYFDAQWRPNLKGMEFERIPQSQVEKAQKLFGGK